MNGPEKRPYEVLIFDEPGSYTFNPADYPWAAGARITVKGGTSSNPDTSGENGYIIVEMFGPLGPRTAEKLR